MKHLLTCLLLTGLCASGLPATAQPAWFTDEEEARQQARELSRPVLMHFSGSDWCLPCMKLERDLFSTEAFGDYADRNLILLKLDFPARKKNQLPEALAAHHEALAARYNPRGTFPLVVLTDAGGNVLGTMPHPLPATEDYLRALENLIRQP